MAIAYMSTKLLCKFVLFAITNTIFHLLASLLTYLTADLRDVLKNACLENFKNFHKA